MKTLEQSSMYLIDVKTIILGSAIASPIFGALLSVTPVVIAFRYGNTDS